MRLFISGMSFALLASGCAQSVPPAEPVPVRSAAEQANVETRVTVGEFAAADNCRLISDYAFGGGEYVVDSVEDLDQRVKVTLTLVSSWTANAPTSVEGSFPSFDARDGASSSNALALDLEDLSAGQHLGLLFDSQPVNGAFSMRSQATFRATSDGHFENRILFTEPAATLEEIGSVFRKSFEEVLNGVACVVRATQYLEPQPEFSQTDGPPLEIIPVDDEN